MARVKTETEVIPIRTSEDFLQLEAGWNSLLARIPDHTPFSTHAWLQSWIEAFGDQVEIISLVAKRGEHTVGIAPLCKWDSGAVTFIGYPQSDYADFLIDPSVPSALETILEAFRELPDNWSRMILDQFPESYSTCAALAACMKQSGYPFRVEKSGPSPAMVLDNIAAARKVYYKQHIANYINKLKKQGNLAFNIYRDSDIAVSRLDDLFEQHIARWKNTTTPSAFASERIRRFYRIFTTRMHRLGWIHFCSLTLDEKFLAFFLSFEYRKKLYLYKPSFNPDYAKTSPGQTILRYLFDYAVQESITEIDFCRGDEAYKQRFSNVTRQNCRLRVYRNRISGTMAVSARRLWHSQPVAAFSRSRFAVRLKEILNRFGYTVK